ncbi:MAG: hypothetical protein H0T51_11075 [Pirellulales bacterium]|nr:hypothetical protein [Pirellulales bacterium]
MPDPTPPVSAPSASRGVLLSLFIVAAIIGAAGALLYFGARLNRQENDRRADDRRRNEFAAIKEGPDDEILIYDAELLAMIVADPDAAERATSLVFSDVDFSDERFAAINKLVRLQNVGVYSSQNADALLKYVEGMASIERMWIETSPIQDDGIRLLATLPNLKKIHFEQEMSAKQIELLEKTLPKVSVDTPFTLEDEPR